MHLGYHQLVGKRIVAANGQTVGRLVDLIAEERDGKLRVTALQAGPVAIIYRFGLRWRPLSQMVARRTVPIEQVDHIGDQIRLRVVPDDLRGAKTSAHLPEPAKASDEAGL
jgi:sporulation protein YlmC with PRC-barrel domain